MRRRDFFTLIGTAAAVWPLAATAQQRAMPVVGVLSPATSDADANRMNAIRQGLKDAGYIEGENVMIEYRSAENQLDRLPALAGDLVSRRVWQTRSSRISPVAKFRFASSWIATLRACIIGHAE
jgi:putative tryptophan/tyrosine transport system substrate-binding protein